MTFSCSSGSSFLLNGHLWVLVSEPSGSPEEVIITYLTSKKPSSDPTVILLPENHDFIKHPTVVSYADARIMRTENIIRRIDQRDFEPRNSFSDEVTETIQRGLIDSPFTPREVKKFFSGQ